MNDWSKLSDSEITIQLLKALMVASTYAYELSQRQSVLVPTLLEDSLDAARELAVRPFSAEDRAAIFDAVDADLNMARLHDA